MTEPETENHAEHAVVLRGLVETQISAIEKRYYQTYHEARNLLMLLQKEHTPLGFDKYRLKKNVASLTAIVKAIEGGK